MGIETKNDFLDRKVSFYNDFRWINNNTPKNSKIFLMYLAPFYLNRDYFIPQAYLFEKYRTMTDKEVLKYLIDNDITHIFVPNYQTLFKNNIQSLLKNKKIINIYSNNMAKLITSRRFETFEAVGLNVFKIIY